MSSEPQLHSSIVAMISLAAGIAAKHPSMGPCQLRRLREMGVPAHQIDEVIEIARHIREEAGQKLDQAFDEAAKEQQASPTVAVAGACCSNTGSGQSCC